MHKTLLLDGNSLSLSDLAPLFSGDETVEFRVSIAPAARKRVRAAVSSS